MDQRGSHSVRLPLFWLIQHDYTLDIADLCAGSTSALASFTGPMEVRLQKDQATRATLEVVHRPLEGIGGTSNP